LVTLELMLADLRDPVYAGDLPVKMDYEKARYEASAGSDDYALDQMNGAGPDEDGDGCGCGCGGGGGCGDGGCGGKDCGGCGAEMADSMAVDPRPGAEPGSMGCPGGFGFHSPAIDHVGDRDKTRDRSPRPDRKRLPWSFASGPGIAS
jgi:hypothetical protein